MITYILLVLGGFVLGVLFSWLMITFGIQLLIGLALGP